MVAETEKSEIQDAIRIAKKILAGSSKPPPKKMDKCPHCGGTSGYTYQLEVRYNQSCTWDGSPIDADTTDGGREFKMCECLNCGKRMRRPLIPLPSYRE